MSVIGSQPIEEEFIEAQTSWELEKLYVDLASAKRKALTPVEKKFLRGLLCGCSPAEIAKRVYQSRSSSTVRVYLSNGLYKYIEDMLSNQLGYSVKLKNWSHVTHLLENAGYKKSFLSIQQTNILIQDSLKKDAEILKAESTKTQDWGEAVSVSDFCGRKTELTQVSDWILQQNCRLIAILGKSGIGKTAFSVKLAQEIQDNFDYVIWRSLHLTPKIDVLITDVMQTLSPKLKIDKTANLNSQISQLIDSLRRVRCLLVLDKFDGILCSDYPQFIPNNSVEQISEIQYLPDYEGYGELIRRIGTCQHQSCLLITSRETPPQLTEIGGKKLPVRSLKLSGLSNEESLQLLNMKGLETADYTDSHVLNEAYSGNPLFLKLVATTIENLFGGNIYQFLAHDTLIFGEIRKILDHQFHRLSELEKYILYWLVLNSHSNSVLALTSSIILGGSQKLGQRLILEALELLHNRLFIEIQSGNVSVDVVWKNYLIAKLKEKDSATMTATNDSILINDPFLSENLQNYIHKSHLDQQI